MLGDDAVGASVGAEFNGRKTLAYYRIGCLDSCRPGVVLGRLRGVASIMQHTNMMAQFHHPGRLFHPGVPAPADMRIQSLHYRLRIGHLPYHTLAHIIRVNAGVLGDLHDPPADYL